MEESEIIYGIHPVETLLESGRKISRILIKKSKEADAKINRLVLQAQVRNIPVKLALPEELERLARGGNHQGILALAAKKTNTAGDDLSGNLYLMLDHITDVHNLGAALRSAEFFRTDGVVLPRDRSAGSAGDVVAKTSAGAVNFLNLITVANLSNELQRFKKNDFWTVGADGRSEKSLFDFEFPKKTLLIMGNEEKGISRILADQLDYKIAIPRFGRTESLNVSVATAVFLAQYRRTHRE